METTKNKLTAYEHAFFDKLRQYIDKPIYFYGSIQRDDYFPQKSDIDIDIFSDNEISTLHMVQNFLDLGKNEFKKSVYKMNKTNKVIHGYKGKYIDLKNNLNVEISLYNEKDKNDILQEHNSKNYIPFYIIFILKILKILHYNLGILPIVYYSRFKKFLTNYCYDNNDAAFVIVGI